MNSSSILNGIVKNKLVSSAFGKFLAFNQSRVPYSEDNPFLAGPFAPVKEEISSTNLLVQGEIPTSLNGVFLRMGPNPLEVKNPANYNWFLGDGMVHGLRLNNGKALWYKNRYVGTHYAQKKLGRKKIKGQQRSPIDIANTNIIGHAGKIWVLTEAGPLPVALDFELNSLNYGFFNSKDSYPFTAHPHLDPESGELHAICYDALLPMQVYYQVIDKTGQVTKRVTIPVKNGPMMHDCSMTKTKMLILDFPVTFSVERILGGAQFPYAWNDNHPARVGSLPKNGGADDVKWFDLDPCVIFHVCNSYDLENGDVILDACVHSKTFTNSIQGPVDQQYIQFERWTLQYGTQTIKREVISKVPQEFPRLDERFVGLPYRFAYSISVGDEGQAVDATKINENALLVHDLVKGETNKHFYEKGYATGEVIFIPKQKNSEEGDGWLISYLHALDGIQASKVVILDSKKIGQEPQAVIDLPVRVPLGFHSNWVDI
ncbi:carotenoid oxygenase family protein [Acinetobacter pittii]|uniref:carotenoid oxygenase family protein n=1 Tax=Acinetobacter pittii TaxID=48296 RepID=UPI00099380A8|nr:carotenoid oxygenase family protein [Acinetobacter pittii]AQV16009.1 carotenoid oxygenase [Acinetobacter pittii]OON27001.1 carotenoid oxygenase [Acinetobacter pittii]